MEKKIFFKNPRGVKLCGVLSNPTNNKSAPIIVLCHGFTTGKDNSTNKSLVSLLNNKGISTFRFDFFGHSESKGKFEDISVSEGRDDALSAIAFVKKLGYKKIGLFGSSFGGISSTLAAAQLANAQTQSNDIFVLALKSPVSDYPECEAYYRTKEEMAEWKKTGYISYPDKNLRLKYAFCEDFENHDVYKEAKKIKIPTLIVHGDCDEEVPVTQSVKLQTKIKNSKLVLIKGADHRYSKKKDFDRIIKLIAEFIVKNTK